MGELVKILREEINSKVAEERIFRILNLLVGNSLRINKQCNGTP